MTHSRYRPIQYNYVGERWHYWGKSLGNPAIAIRTAGGEVKKLDWEHAHLCTSGSGTIYVTINGPGDH